MQHLNFLAEDASTKRERQQVRGYIKRQVLKVKKLILPAYDEHDTRASLVDVLTDLRHFADANKIDFFDALDSSYMHYLAEKKGGQHG